MMIGVFIMISVLGSRYIAKSTSTAPIWIHGLVKNQIIEKILIIQISAKELDDIDSEMAKLEAPSAANATNQQSASDWVLLTAILDRFYLIVYIIAFIFYHS